MIVIANEELVTVMRLLGVSKSFTVYDPKKIQEIVKAAETDELILVSPKIVHLVPELKEHLNVAIIPDEPKELSSVKDINHIIKDAVGVVI